VTWLTIFPLPGGRIDETKQFKGRDSLGIQVNPDRFLPHQGIRPVERAKDLALACAGIANNEDGVSDMT